MKISAYYFYSNVNGNPYSSPCGSTSNQQTLIDNQSVRVFHIYFWRVFGVIAQKNTLKRLASGCSCNSISYVEICCKGNTFSDTYNYTPILFLSTVSDCLTKAAATKPPQEGDSPTPQPLADSQPSESL